MNLPPYFRPLAEDVAEALEGAPEAAAVDGLLALGVAFAHLSPKAAECGDLYRKLGRTMFEGVVEANFPRPSGLVRVRKAKATGGVLSRDAYECAEIARLAIGRRKLGWTRAGSPWAGMSNADVSVFLLVCAARCANPSNLSWREWEAVIARAWEARALELDVDVVVREAA